MQREPLFFIESNKVPHVIHLHVFVFEGGFVLVVVTVEREKKFFLPKLFHLLLLV